MQGDGAVHVRGQVRGPRGVRPDPTHTRVVRASPGAGDDADLVAGVGELAGERGADGTGAHDDVQGHDDSSGVNTVLCQEQCSAGVTVLSRTLFTFRCTALTRETLGP
nr:hypothetical protein DA06_08915 [Georgenia sp. SUBG003]